MTLKSELSRSRPPVKVEDVHCHTQSNSHILVVLLDTTEEPEATSATELVRPGMP